MPRRRSCRRSPGRRSRSMTTSCRCSEAPPASASARWRSRAVAGENKAGEPGYVQIVDCATGAEGPGMSVEVGWSKIPNAKINWKGGPVSGIIAPGPPHAHSAGRGERSAGPRAEPRRRRSTAFPTTPLLCGAMVHLRCNRADHLRARAEEAAGRGAAQAVSGEMHVLANGLTVAVDPLRRRRIGRARASTPWSARAPSPSISTALPTSSSIWCSRAPARAAPARSPRRSRTSAGSSTPGPRAIRPSSTAARWPRTRRCSPSSSPISSARRTWTRSISSARRR